MAVRVIAGIDVIESEAYAENGCGVPATLDVMEGEWRTAILGFPTVE